MSSKQTDENREKEVIPADWFPTFSLREKRGSAKPTGEHVEAESPKKHEDGISPKPGVTDEHVNSVKTKSPMEAKDSVSIAASLQTEPPAETSTTPKRISSKQRKESLEEYRQTFLLVPRLEDRKPVFISREVRDRLDEIVRRLGGRRMSVSGFVENLTRHHLEIYGDDVEMWKKL